MNVERASQPQPLDFREFHRVELPRLLASGNGALALAGVGRAGPLAFRIHGGDAYTYVPQPDRIDVVPGDEPARTVIELSQESWEGLAQEFESVPGLIYGGKIQCTRGHAMTLMRWDPPLRAMYSGRPYFDPDDCRLEDRNGRAIDPRRSFRLGDDRDEMADFLRTTGFLVVREVFSQPETRELRDEAWKLHAAAGKGDKKSWWGKNAAGEEILCRVLDASRQPGLRALPTDPRMLGLVALSDENLSPRDARSEEGVSVIFKNPGMREGLGDLPWHRDCGMGGHAVMCPLLIASVFLTPATAATGALRVLPGSWQGASHFIDASHARAPEGVILEAQPGDVSLHYGDTMHAAPAPQGSGQGEYRISAVSAYVRAGARPHAGRRHYNDVLLSNEDGQIDHMEKLVD